jgi:RND family efflux transporter MFP subunit
MQQYHQFLYGLFACSFASNLLAEELALPTVDCVITPSKVIEISAAVPGLVEALYVDRTDQVTKGQLLGVLKADVEKASVNLAEARSKMTAEMSAEQVNLKYDRIQSSRVNQLGEKKLASSQNLDEASRIKKVTYWRLKQAEESLTLRELELARAQAQLEEKRVYSTMDGVVAERYKNEGEYVEEEPIFRLVQLNPLYIETVFPMTYYSRIRKGMTATAFPEIDQKTGYSVKVDLVDPLGDAASGTFGVRLLLDNTDAKLPAGLKCFLQIDEQQSAETTETEGAPLPIVSSNIPNQSQPDLVSSVEHSHTTLTSAKKTRLEVEAVVDADVSSIVQNSVDAANSLESTVEPKSDAQKVTGPKRLGPFTTQAQVDSVQLMLDEANVSYTQEVTKQSKLIGYMVISSAAYTQKTSTLMAQFTQAGVKDMGRLPKSSYDGRISFGVYNGPVQAEARKAKLTKLGVRAEVITRTKQVDSYWVSVGEISQPLLKRLSVSAQH